MNSSYVITGIWLAVAVITLELEYPWWGTITAIAFLVIDLATSIPLEFSLPISSLDALTPLNYTLLANIVELSLYGIIIRLSLIYLRSSIK